MIENGVIDDQRFYHGWFVDFELGILSTKQLNESSGVPVGGTCCTDLSLANFRNFGENWMTPVRTSMDSEEPRLIHVLTDGDLM